MRTTRFARHQSFGRCLSALATEDGGQIRDTLLPASVELPRHAHRAAYVCVVLDGAYHETWRRDHRCQNGSVLIHPAGFAHANRIGPQGARCLNLEFGASLDGDPALSARLAHPQHISLPPTHAALGTLRRALACADPLASHEAALALLQACALLPDEAGSPPWLSRVTDALEADLARTPALAELAALVSLHPHHLARAFKNERQETIGAYLRRRRLETADAALRTQRGSLTEIALSCGFYDQAHFTRAYRQQYGLTPGQRRHQFSD